MHSCKIAREFLEESLGIQENFRDESLKECTEDFLEEYQEKFLQEFLGECKQEFLKE